MTLNLLKNFPKNMVLQRAVLLLIIITLYYTSSSGLAASPTILKEVESGGIWPTFVASKLINASPETIAAVFWDCEKDVEYIENCSKVSKVNECSNSVIANYTIKMPFFLEDEIYQSTNKVSIIKNEFGKGYKIAWIVPKSVYSLGAKGSITIVPANIENTTSLVTYENLAVPASKFAKLLKRKAGNQIIGVIDSLEDQVYKESKDNSLILKQQIIKLNKCAQ